jgi:DNA repair protein RadC
MKELKSLMPQLKLKYVTTDQKKVKIQSSDDAYQVLKKFYDPDTIEYQESSVALFMNRANNTIGWMQISTGGMSGTVIDSKILFATALKCGASAIILSHNHPSGQLKASSSDLILTKKIAKIGKLLDLQLLDHLIITTRNYFSMADEGLIINS